MSSAVKILPHYTYDEWENWEGKWEKDRHTKFSIYEAQGIPYYLIVSIDAEETEVYALESNVYMLKQKGKNFMYTFLFEGCEATIDFTEIW